MGFGAGGSLFGALLAWAGFKQRLDRADADIAALHKATEADMATLKASVVFKDTCGVCHAATLRAVDGVDKKMDLVLQEIRKK